MRVGHIRFKTRRAAPKGSGRCVCARTPASRATGAFCPSAMPPFLIAVALRRLAHCAALALLYLRLHAAIALSALTLDAEPPPRARDAARRCWWCRFGWAPTGGG